MWSSFTLEWEFVVLFPGYLPFLILIFRHKHSETYLISVEYLLTKQTIARRQEWANKDISANNINNYNINSVTRLIHFLTLYFQQQWWDFYLESLVSLGRNNFLTYGVEIRKLEITCMSSDGVTTDCVLFTHLPKSNWYQVTTSGVVWELFVSRIRLPTSLSIQNPITLPSTASAYLSWLNGAED